MATRRPRGAVTIGVALSRLQEEFADVSISKLRYLEAEGLVTPTRTESGYRYFTPADIERVRFVLRAQRDQFLPLKVIREALEAMDRGLTPDLPGGGARTRVPDRVDDPDVPAAGALAAPPSLRLTRDELCAAAGLLPDQLDDLISFGIITVGPDGHLDDAALAAGRAAGALYALGLGARHLRPFRNAADREVGLAETARPRTRSMTPEDAREAQAEVAHHCLALHTALVKAALRAP